MNRSGTFFKLFASVLTAIVLLSVSVQETHYLFTEHASHEHCENHLHNQDDHGDCAICKFDVSVFTNIIAHPQLTQSQLLISEIQFSYQSSYLTDEVSFYSLRGPPQSV